MGLRTRGSHTVNSREATMNADDTPQSLLMMLIRQFAEHKLAVFGFLMVVLFLLVALLAPVISHVSGIDPNEQNVFHRYAPPGTRTTLSNDDQVAAMETFIAEHP